MGEDSEKISISIPPAIFRYFNLFFNRRFILHRQLGLLYLIEFCLSIYYYINNYNYFKDSFLIWSLPLTGLLQSIVAIYTFTFLPKRIKTDGYFGDKGTLNYDFVKENSFFAMLLLFQWLYYNDRFYSVIRSTFFSEFIIVFFPYVIRVMWPKSSFSEAVENVRNKSSDNQQFFIIATYITKFFYIWAKHYIGYFLNYLRFLDRINEEEKYHVYFVLIFSAFATTISVFLHTLKFKGYITPRVSFLVYQASYFATFYGFYMISGIFAANLDITLITLGGLLINFASLKYQHLYQVIVMIVLYAARMNSLPVVFGDAFLLDRHLTNVITISS